MTDHHPKLRTRALWSLAALLLFAGAWVMLPYGDLNHYGTVPAFLLGAFLMLGGFFLALAQKSPPLILFWSVALGLRLLLLWQTPNEDIYRYIWEGHALVAGHNPYLHSPDSPELAMLRNELWQKVEFKQISAIYPPLAEWVFAGMSLIHPSPFFFKFVFTLADLFVAWLLVRNFGAEASLIYAWNPLVIYCFAGGGHYDSLFVLSLVLGWLEWRRGRSITSMGWIGVAVALKWMVLPLVAWGAWRVFWSENQKKKAIIAMGIALGTFFLSWVALNLWTHEWTFHLLPTTFSQYARSAEFFPGIVGWFWKPSLYQNQWFLPPLAIGWLCVIVRARKIEDAAQWLFFITFLLTPMVHAWYFTWLVPFAVVTRNKGTLLLSASGFTYFLIYHHCQAPGGTWGLLPAETFLLWLPFIAGFLWSESHPILETGVPRRESSK